MNQAQERIRERIAQVFDETITRDGWRQEHHDAANRLAELWPVLEAWTTTPEEPRAALEAIAAYWAGRQEHDRAHRFMVAADELPRQARPQEWHLTEGHHPDGRGYALVVPELGSAYWWVDYTNELRGGGELLTAPLLADGGIEWDGAYEVDFHALDEELRGTLDYVRRFCKALAVAERVNA